MYIQIQSCFHDTVSASIAHSITEENQNIISWSTNNCYDACS